MPSRSSGRCGRWGRARVVFDRDAAGRLRVAAMAAVMRRVGEGLASYRMAPGAAPDARLARARRERGYTQEDVAEVMGIRAVSLSRLETGDRALSLSTLAAVSDALGVPLGDLLDEARELPSPPEAKPENAELVRLFERASSQRQTLLLSLARELSKG